MPREAISLHVVIFRDLVRLHTFTLVSLPKSRKAAAKAAKKAATAANKAAAAATAKQASSAGSSGRGGPSGSGGATAAGLVVSPPSTLLAAAAAAPSSRRETWARLGGWILASFTKVKKHDKVLRALAKAMIDEGTTISRPEASAFSAIQQDPGSIRVGAMDLVMPHSCCIDYLEVMHGELDGIMERSTLLSLRSTAFLTWEDRMEASHSLHGAWMKMLSELSLTALPKESDLVWFRGEGQAKARHLQGVVFQKARNALVNEMLEWGGAAKAGEETVDLAFRDLLKGATLSKQAESDVVLSDAQLPPAVPAPPQLHPPPAHPGEAVPRVTAAEAPLRKRQRTAAELPPPVPAAQFNGPVNGGSGRVRRTPLRLMD